MRWIIWIMSERDDISARKDSNNIVLGAYTAYCTIAQSNSNCRRLLTYSLRTIYQNHASLPIYTRRAQCIFAEIYFAWGDLAPGPRKRAHSLWVLASAANRDGKRLMLTLLDGFSFSTNAAGGGSQRAFMQKMMCGLFSLFDWAESDTDYLKLSNLHTNTTRERFLPRCWLGALGKMHTKSRLWWKTRGVLP